MRKHVTYYGMEATQPNIRLLSCRRVEYPLAVLISQLLPFRRVAVLLTELVRFLMLALEVEDINCEDDLIKEPIFLGSQMFLQATVVVEEDHCWEILLSEIVDQLQKVLYYIVIILNPSKSPGYLPSHPI